MVNVGAAMNKGLTLRMGQCNVKRYMPHLLEHIREGRINARGIISHRFPLEEAAEAYRIFFGAEGGQPPHGLSGLMRCAAYEIPDYQPRRWLLLVLADRVDSLEGRLASLAASPAMWGPPSARRPPHRWKARARRRSRFSLLRRFMR